MQPHLNMGNIPKVISVCINGTTQQFEPPISVADLIQRMALSGKRVALERNGEIVPRSRFSEQLLMDGDKLEIIAAVGGG